MADDRKYELLSAEAKARVLAAFKKTQDAGWVARSPRESFLGLEYSSATFEFLIPDPVPAEFVTLALDSMDCMLTAVLSDLSSVSLEPDTKTVIAKCWLRRDLNGNLDVLLSVQADKGKKMAMKDSTSYVATLGAMRTLLEHKGVVPDVIFARTGDIPGISFACPGKMLPQHATSIVDGCGIANPAATLKAAATEEMRTRAKQVLKLCATPVKDLPMFLRS